MKLNSEQFDTIERLIDIEIMYLMFNNCGNNNKTIEVKNIFLERLHYYLNKSVEYNKIISYYFSDYL